MGSYNFGDDNDTLISESNDAPSNRSVYDLVRKQLSSPPVVKSDVTIKVPTRPGFAVRYSTDLPLDRMDRWSNAARKKKGGDVDVNRYNAMVIANQAIAIVYQGEDVMDSTGNEPLTFHHAEFKEMLQAFDTAAGIQNFFGRDADIVKTVNEILEACGYDNEELSSSDEDDDVDPLG